MNKKILKLITSTGLVIIHRNDIYLFHDKYSGFRKDKEESDIFYFNNMHHDVFDLDTLEVFKFFYYYPLQQEKMSLFNFFQLFLLNFDKYIYKYSSFIWSIGKLTIKGNMHATRRAIKERPV